MAFLKGFTLLELLVTFAVLGLLIGLAGVYWGWSADGVKEQAYVRSIEDLILRSKRSAEILEQPVALCFSLSDKCLAEGVLVPRDDRSVAGSPQRWQLLEALPVKDGILLGTNFNEQQLIIQAGGHSVRQPGTIHVCSINKKLPYAWILVVARSGRVSSQKIEGLKYEKICHAFD